MMEMKRTYLIQRLQKPLGRGPNPFSFGGGLVNGGLSDGAMDLVKNIFDFDYMGASEFEWGAVPEALQKVAAHQKRVAYSFLVEAEDIVADPYYKSRGFEFSDSTIYVLCSEDQKEEVSSRIRGILLNKQNLKEDLLIHHTLNINNDPQWRVSVGWFELDNGFFFFTDKEMWESTCKLFGIESQP